MAKLRKVIRTGNSLAITIPSKLIKAFNVKDGDLATYKVKYSEASITYTFSGSPRQLSLMEKTAKK